MLFSLLYKETQKRFCRCSYGVLKRLKLEEQFFFNTNFEILFPLVASVKKRDCCVAIEAQTLPGAYCRKVAV